MPPIYRPTTNAPLLRERTHTHHSLPDRYEYIDQQYLQYEYIANDVKKKMYWKQGLSEVGN